jgi:hypothetical protein
MPAPLRRRWCRSASPQHPPFRHGHPRAGKRWQRAQRLVRGGDDQSAWWQPIPGDVAIDAVEVVSRWAIDQPNTRRSYRVLASKEPSFASPVVLGEVDATGLPHRAIFAVNVSPPISARYVRVAKTAPEYFFLGEVLVHGKPAG